jgi:ABC-type transport system substrate-binding protein
VKPDLTLIYWSPYYPDLANYLTALLSTSRPVPDFTGYSSADLDKAADQLRTTTGEAATKVRMKIGDILDREMPWIPLYYETPLILTKPYVRNFTINPVSVMLLPDVELDLATATDGRGQ